MIDDFDYDTETDSWSDPSRNLSRVLDQDAEADLVRAEKAQAKLIAKRKAFCDALWDACGPGTLLRKPEPSFVRMHLAKVRIADYADGALNPKEYGYILWAARFLRVRRSRDVLGGLCRFDASTEYCFAKSNMADFYFEQVLRYSPKSYEPRARYARRTL